MSQREFQYKLTGDDYLQYVYWNDYKTETSKKARNKGRGLYSLVPVFVGILFYRFDNQIMAVYFSIIGVVMFFVYPSWGRNAYVKHFKKHVDLSYGDFKREERSLVFNPDSLFSIGLYDKWEYKYEGIAEVVELNLHFLIAVKTGGAVVLPKRAIEDPEEFGSFLQSLSDEYQFDFAQRKDWQWK